MKNFNIEKLVELVFFFIFLAATIILSTIFIGIIDNLSFRQILCMLTIIGGSGLATYCFYELNKETIDAIFKD